jgi:holliday junction DNA helicase RuvA
MIDYIEGVLAVKAPSYAVVQSGGLGIRGHISLTTFEDLPQRGEPVRLWTVLQVREEEFNLFAFSTQEERWIFQHLITVNGVGPKLAIVALSAARPEVIRRAVVEGDSARLRSIPRIGAKIAERIVLELKKKLGAEIPEFVSSGGQARGGDVQEAIDALCALGFTRMEAERAVDGAIKRGGKGIEELVKFSLRAP